MDAENNESGRTSQKKMRIWPNMEGDRGEERRKTQSEFGNWTDGERQRLVGGGSGLMRESTVPKDWGSPLKIWQFGEI